MPKQPRDPAPASTDLKHALQHKTRTRRRRQTALVAVERGAPPPRNDLRPGLALRTAPIVDLKRQVRRARRKEIVHVAETASSIGEYGFITPVLVGADLSVIDGETRIDAALQMGMSEVPILVIDHLPPSKIRKLKLTLNRLQEKGAWDIDVLRIELQELIVLGEDLVTTGFSDEEVDILLLEEDEDGPARSDDLRVSEVAISQTGQIWQMGDHLLAVGDARDPQTYRLLFGQGAAARFVLTDEPFNVPNVGHVTGNALHREFEMAHGEMSLEAFLEFNIEWMQAALAYVMDGGLLATFMDWRSVEVVLRAGRKLELNLLNFIVWTKTNAGQGSLWRSQHELLPVFKKGTAAHVNNVALGHKGRWRSNSWTYAGASSLGSDARAGLKDHPTVKPVAMLEDALLDVTQRGEIVLDPFAGSGSTLIAAERTGRCCRAIEIDALYCDLIVRRWQRLSGKNAILVDTGERFDALAGRQGRAGS